jgi:GLPGLI family protein
MIKRIIKISIILLFYSLNGTCQTSNSFYKKDSVTCVTYKLVMPENLHPERPYNERIMNLEQAIDNLEYELYFTENNSVFRQIEKLGFENEEYKLISSVFTGDTYFKDIKQQKKIIKKNNYGLNLIVPLDKFKWNLTTETKMISGFKCYKATCLWGEFDRLRNKQLTFSSEVWYTPEIPAPFGPINLDGLPGLVLEADLGAAYSHYYVTKIAFNAKKKTKDVNLPTKGKFLTEEEYEIFKTENNAH